MALVLLAPLVMICVYASLEKEPVMLALGDSITTGYGLANYEPGGDPYLCESYANTVAASLWPSSSSRAAFCMAEITPRVRGSVSSAR